MKKTLDEFDAAMKKTARMLSKRMHSSAEIRQKLRRAACSDEIITKVVAELCKLAYLDDARFASGYAAELSKKGIGRNLILKKMMLRGIPRELCEVNLPFDKDIEKEKALSFLDSKKRVLLREQNKLKLKGKIFRMLSAKGFRSDIISEILSECKYSPADGVQ
jgi:regulatory protein